MWRAALWLVHIVWIGALMGSCAGCQLVASSVATSGAEGARLIALGTGFAVCSVAVAFACERIDRTGRVLADRTNREP